MHEPKASPRRPAKSHEANRARLSAPLRALAIAGVATAVLRGGAGCGAFEGDGAVANGAALDASSPISEAAASADAPSPEAGVDAAWVCPPSAIFCDSFDGPEDLGATWSVRVSEPPGTLTRSPGNGGGSALGATLGERDGGSSRQVHLRKQLVTLAPRTPFTIELDMLWSTTDGVGLVDVYLFRTLSPYYSLYLRSADYDPRFFLAYYGDAIGDASWVGNEHEISGWTPNQWHHVKCSLTFTAGVHATLRVDDETTFDGELPGAMPYMSEPVEVVAGIGRAERAGGALTLLTDNFVVTSP